MLLLVADIQVNKDILEKAKMGDGDSLSRIGDIYYIKGDCIKAMDWYRWGDTHNSSHSQFSLGYMYSHGKEVYIDYEVAMKWHLKAHKNGHVMATQNIGFSYDTGNGVRMIAKPHSNGFSRQPEKVTPLPNIL
jgi:TPR repeat protein